MAKRIRPIKSKQSQEAVKITTTAPRIYKQGNYTVRDWTHSGETVGVKSSNVASISYDRIRKYLYVTFKDGATYRYVGISLSVAKNLFNASSIGKYLAAYIKHRYSYQRL